MFDGITIFPSYGEPLQFSLPAGGDGYLIRDIEGLGPVPVTHASSTQALMDGEAYQGSRREKRNLIFHIKLDQNYSGSSIESRRRRLDQLALSGLLRIEFDMSDGRELEIEGVVETAEPSIFSSEPLYVLSVVCYDPNFRSREPNTRTRTISNNLVHTTPIDYPGSVPAGFEIFVTIPLSTTAKLDLRNVTNNTRLVLGPMIGEGSNHNWRINTIPGKKIAWETTKDKSVMAWLDFDTLVWPKLSPGENALEMYATGAFVAPWSVEIQWHDLYGAI